MSAVVIYYSETGFTQRYAQWIAEKAQAPCLAYSEAKSKDLSSYDTIIFGGWAYIGGITKIKWFKANMDQWADKKLIVFCVGASPAENPDIEVGLKNNFSEEEFEKIDVFYCPGGLNYEKMPMKSKLMMKAFVKMMTRKKDKSDQEKEMLKFISASYDISDIKYIEPIIESIENSQL